MARRVALLLNDEDNGYERALAAAAQLAARRHGFELLPPHFAAGSPVQQLSAVFAFQRAGLDACLVTAVAPDAEWSAIENLLRAKVAVVLLNREPADLKRARAAHPGCLLASVLPDQAQIGRLQGEQCLKLLPDGGFVLLVTGAEQSPSTVMRRAGFLERVEPTGVHAVHKLEGRWTTEGARQAVSDWFKFGADRHRALDLVVCQNDPMAVGVRSALEAQAAAVGKTELARTPITGVDGLPAEGQRRVRDGELVATVVMPLTTGPAMEILAAHWAGGAPELRRVLPGDPFPALEHLTARRPKALADKA